MTPNPTQNCDTLYLVTNKSYKHPNLITLFDGNNKVIRLQFGEIVFLLRLKDKNIALYGLEYIKKIFHRKRGFTWQKKD